MANQTENNNFVDLKIDFFKFDLKADKQKAFEKIYKDNDGEWSAIKPKLSGMAGFTDVMINNLEFTHHLAEWGSNNAKLVSIFQKDEKIHSLRDIALTLNKTTFIKKVKAVAPNGAEEKPETFALNLHNQLFHIEPTAMLVNIIKDPEVLVFNDPISVNVASVLENQPTFNIKTTSVYEILNNKETLKDIPVKSQEAVTNQLKNLQRIVAISPVLDAVPMLYNANIHSAMQISALPKAQFMAAFIESDLDENTLAQIHHNAQQSKVRNEHFLMSIREAGQATGVALIDKSLSANKHPQAAIMRPVGSAIMTAPTREEYVKEKISKHNLSWDLLFGDADFCECGECNSVYSAAAYYVELLQYLRNNNLDPSATGPIVINPDPKDISNTPLEKLFDRRPDLGCLELTCKNINTLIPYVDLVNEVMENYVAFKHLKPFNVDNETSSELLAEPQHTEYKAYCILKNAVYPFTLPYHQPIDATRIYLKYLDTSRYELIDTFRKNNAGDDADLTILKDKALDRATDAEFLELTKEEYVILTKECFESKALLDKLKDKIHTETEYEEFIGVKPVHEYYGFDDEATMLGDAGLTLIKHEFLRRTGIDYFNLVDLLKTETLNPFLPTGKSKAIMDSLRFSYRFLQNYAKVHGIDKMAEELVKWEKLADLLPLLKEQIEELTDKKVLSCPKPVQGCSEITDKDIICWIKCHFEKVGKMIVIESGSGCIDGVIIGRNMHGAMLREWKQEFPVVQDCKIYFKINNDLEVIGNIDKKTGKVSFNALQPPVEEKTLNNSFFLSDKGEKGIFLIVNNEVYLVFFEQKDSCDLDSALLQHLDGTPLTVDEYDKIHRFIRLWRKLGWTIDEIDKSIVGLSISKTQEREDEKQPDHTVCDGAEDDCNSMHGDCSICEEDTFTHQDYNISPFLVHQLVAVKKLLDQTGLELIKLLSFWTVINTAGDKSLYQRLFLTHNILGIDNVFKADDRGNYLISDATLLEHTPAVMAALNLSADDIQAIMQASGMEDKLTLSNLSILYRYRLLSKILGLRIPAFISILPLYGNIFQDAHASLKFMKQWVKMEDAGFNYQQLNYIIQNVDDEKKPFAPSQKQVLLLSKALYDGLNTIDETHKDLIADPEITDAGLQKINIQEQATSALIRTKASLLFDTSIVEQVIGLLEGSNSYITNAPKNLEFTISDEKSLNKKLKYDKTIGTIQITGILTDAEKVDYESISADLQWKSALTRIEKQQKKLFKELLSGIFENEKTKTADEKAQLEAVIKLGDISIPLDKIPEGEEDTNTAPKKHVAFLEIFLPYLRQQLTHRFVIDTLADFSELEMKVTDVLVSEVLKLGDPVTPIYSIFEDIKDSSKPVENNWSGYLIPTADTHYTFIVKDSDTKPVISLDGVNLDFTAEEDPTNEWWSISTELEAGKLYKLATTGVELKNIVWKTPASAITLIPSSALMPGFAYEQCEPALIALKKAAMLISGFELGADEIKFLELHKANFDNLDINALTLVHWLRLDAYTRLRNSLPQTELNILDFWNWAYDDTSDATELSINIGKLTNWKQERVDKLIANNHFNITELEDYRNEINLLKLQKAIKVTDKIGMDIDLLFDWAIPTSKFNKCRQIADSINNAIRARYTQTDWEFVIKPLNDQLRNHQKEALVGYLLQQEELITWNVTDADGLFEYFLIDVQMDACMETSRIKQAISSVQLFVQRCLLGLEEEHNGIKSDILDRSRWEWMQRYRVWEANRKVFLYPENWIESNLRDDKSPFFKELESELLQKDINKQNITDALKSYLYKVDEVANMEVVGLYIDGTRSGTQWSGNAKLHVFSRTRNAPYFFYYRYLALDEMNWYAWEKMQIDIPSYDVVNPDTQEVTGNGCYLIPVVWNGRLLIFFPQIMKKTRPNDTSQNQSNRASADSTPEQLKPEEFYEIKMAWSEYRNGKWTQKQISKDTVYSDLINNVTDIQFFKFVPIIYSNKVLIDVDDNFDNDGGFKGAFEFNGNNLQKGTKVSTSPIPIDYFNQDNGNMYSWQIKSLTLVRQVTDIYFYENNSKERLQGLTNAQNIFHHPFTTNLLGKINLGNLESFFQENLSMMGNDFGLYDQNSYHELKRPYSLYNWELFFHTPILLADELSKAQQFEEAMKWFHFVFNPIADGDEDNRFWEFKPFKEIDSQRILDSIFNSLKPNTADQTINEWRDKPFMPHVVARNRPVAYMKWVVMKYIDNLVAWGDYLFRQDTIESINQATQLYVLAGHILGSRPMMIPKRGKIKAQTYLSLLDKWDAFGNAIVELELAAPFSNQTTLPFSLVNDEIVLANIFGSASSLYFCIPNNPKLMGYWDTLEDRLYKIRHCQNISGVFRKLALFEPPIDPALLVKAAAQGLSIASVLNDLNSPMPNYRFYYLLQKALELCNELKSLGAAMLSAIEKKDNESIALIRAKHESVMQNLVMEIKKSQLEEAQKNLESLVQNRKAPAERMKYYLKLSGLDESLIPNETADFTGVPNEIVTVDGDSGLKLISFEKEDMDRASDAQDKQVDAALPEKIASILHIIPNFGINLQPWGIGASVTLGGSNLGAAAQAWAKFLQLDASELSYASSSAGKKGGFTRALQDRTFQVNAAGYELKQIDKQITAQEIRINIANQEILNQQKAIDNANEVEEFLKNKYTNEELYTWMRGNLKTLYHQVYNLAYDLAKKSEKTYCFERGLSSANFIQSGYFDAGREGLLAGEQLYVGLKQLEQAYQNERGHDYEIVKHLSLSQINPLAVIELKQSGKCEFIIPEVLFDMDYPGHFKRRIKSVSISIPCIAGPYTGINATLSLLENKFRNTAIGGKAYEENIEETDNRFKTYIIPINAIATSSAQNDSGLFELNFKDERYLPFEGAGAISKWRLELPDLRQFDYQTISDAIIHLKYTSSEGGERLKLAATKSLSKQLENIEQELNETGLHIALSLKHDLSNEWHLFKKNGSVDLKIDKSRLPYMAQLIDADATIENIIFIAQVKGNPKSHSINIDGETINLARIDEWKLCRGNSEDIKLDTTFKLSVIPAELEKLEEIVMVVKYSFI